MGVKSIKYKRIIFWSSLTIGLLAVIITIITINSTPLKPCVSLAVIDRPTVIIDAGHGGIDGGAVSTDGALEADINLLISVKLYDLMRFLGVDAIMTRTDDGSLAYNAEQSIRDNKNADLKARLALASENPECDFLSVHLNHFEQSQYYGAQVFYSPSNPLSSVLAGCIQNSFVTYVDPTNYRTEKQSHESIYLMKHIKSPAVTIECGFLSNPNEAKLLCSDSYQTHIGIAIAKGYLDYIKER